MCLFVFRQRENQFTLRGSRLLREIHNCAKSDRWKRNGLKSIRLPAAKRYNELTVRAIYTRDTCSEYVFDAIPRARVKNLLRAR